MHGGACHITCSILQVIWHITCSILSDYEIWWCLPHRLQNCAGDVTNHLQYSLRLQSRVVLATSPAVIYVCLQLKARPGVRPNSYCSE